MSSHKINQDFKKQSVKMYNNSLFKKSFYENYKAYVNALKHKEEELLSDRIFDISVINQNIKKASTFFGLGLGLGLGLAFGLIISIILSVRWSVYFNWQIMGPILLLVSGCLGGLIGKEVGEKLIPKVYYLIANCCYFITFTWLQQKQRFLDYYGSQEK